MLLRNVFKREGMVRNYKKKNIFFKVKAMIIEIKVLNSSIDNTKK